MLKRSFLVDDTGIVGPLHNCYGRAVSPVVFLKSSVVVTGGTGTQADPYILQ